VRICKVARGYLLTMISSVVTLAGSSLVGFHFLQFKKEADFRYALARVRENAESITFFRGEKRERRDLLSPFLFM
jgi:putative ATP-binding cassette transporter